MEFPDFDRLVDHNNCVRNNFHSIYVIKDTIATEDIDKAAEAWFELTDKEQLMLWVAPSKGGIFTSEEREIIKSSEFRIAHYGE